MRCPSCKEPDTRVVDSRDLDDGAVIRRRRACRICGTRVTTYERAELAKLYVIKRSGERQEYDSQKLLEGLRREAKILRQILTGQSLDPRRLRAEFLPRHIGPPKK